MAEIENIYQSNLFDSFDLEFPERFVENLGLTFLGLEDFENLVGLSVKNENASAVCYADTPELREEFKTKTIPLAFSPLNWRDYLYAISHASSFREERENLKKTDFLKVPCPKDKEAFWQLVNLGGELRELHLLISPTVKKFITTYPQGGSNIVIDPIPGLRWELYDVENNLGRIWINDVQYFDEVPLVAWDFYINGDYPARKWLKDRKGRQLSSEEILHYQKIIVALFETERIIKAIDKVGV